MPLYQHLVAGRTDCVGIEKEARTGGMIYVYPTNDFAEDYVSFLKVVSGLTPISLDSTEADLGLFLAAKYPASEAVAKARLVCRMRAYVLSHPIFYGQLKTTPATTFFQKTDNAFAALYPEGVARDFDAPTVLMLEAKAREIELQAGKNPAG
jgi:hypothetical protein